MTTFRIKRSPTSGNPSTLAQGELAYSYLTNNGSNGGDILYVGTGTETAGNAANHVKIGGLYYTTLLDNATSSNTASAIVRRDASGNFTAGTITAALTGNASTATKWATARDLSLTGDATATLSSVDGSAAVSAALTLASVNSNAVTLTTTGASGTGTTATITYATQASNPFTVGQSITVTGVTPNGYNGTYIVTGVSTTQVQYANATTGSQSAAGTVVANFGSSTFIPVITVNAKGLITAITNTAISTTVNLAGSTGTGSVAGGGTLTVTGGAGISTSVSGSTITISSTGAGGYTTTVTSGTTYTLSSTSTPAQYFTGSTVQVVKLPDATGLTLGQEYILTNNSSANLTVNTSTSASVLTQIPGTTVTYTVVSTGGNTAAAWNYEYTGFAGVTGTGNAVLANAPTLTGHPTIEGVTSTGATGTGNLVFSASPTFTGTLTAATGSFSGHVTVEGVTSTGATGTGKFVFDNAPTISGHPTIEGVTSTGATGTGKFVFDTSPTLVTPTLGVATATSINGLTISTTTGTLTIANSKTLTVNNTLTFTGTDSSSVAFGTGGTVVYTSNKLSVFAATSSSELAGVISDETGSGSLVFGTSPTLTTPTIVTSATFNGSTSGTTVIQATGVASGTLTLPAATDTLVGKATTDTFTNKTFDTAGTGNSFKINGTSVSAVTGTGSTAVLAAGPTLTGTIKLADISIATDTISNSTATTNIIIAPTGKVQFGSGSLGSGAAYQFPAVDSTNSGYVLTSQANGTLIWAAASSSLSLAGTGSTTGSTNLVSGTLSFAGGTNVTAAISGTSPNATVTISVGDATTTTKGIASFSSTYFSVSSGAVSPVGVTGTGNFVLASAPTITGHPTIEGVTSTGATGTGNLVFSASPTFTGTASIATLNLTNALGVAYGGTGTTNGNITGTGALSFTAGGSNTNVNLAPQGTGTVDVNNKRITSLADPTAATDAVTKQYVDAATQGLNVHDSVDVFADSTNTAITGATYSNGTSDTSGGTGIGATLTDATSGTVLSIDGYTVQQYDRVMVNAFTSTSAKYNGIYTLTTVGVNGSTKWVLTRATDFNNSTSGQVRPGDFAFIYRGTTYKTTGWVQTTIGTGTPFETIKIGIDAISFTQFSGAGVYSAGNGLTLTGTQFSIDTSITVDKTTSQTLTNKTLSTGVVYNGGVIGSTYGGTGVNNGSSTITIGGNVTFSGAYTFSGTLSGNTSVTFPTTGTLVNTAVTSLSSLATVGTITSGTWNGAVIGSGYGGTGFSTYATGDLIYASASNTLSKLSAGSNGQVLQLVSGVPAWADLDGGTY